MLAKVQNGSLFHKSQRQQGIIKKKKIQTVKSQKLWYGLFVLFACLSLSGILFSCSLSLIFSGAINEWVGGRKAEARVVEKAERMDPGDFPMNPERECGTEEETP